MNNFLHLTLNVSYPPSSHFIGIWSFKMKNLFARAFCPTLSRFDLPVLNFVCLEIKIWINGEHTIPKTDWCCCKVERGPKHVFTTQLSARDSSILVLFDCFLTCLTAFYVILVPMEYIPNEPPHSAYVIVSFCTCKKVTLFSFEIFRRLGASANISSASPPPAQVG